MSTTSVLATYNEKRIQPNLKNSDNELTCDCVCRQTSTLGVDFPVLILNVSLGNFRSC